MNRLFQDVNGEAMKRRNFFQALSGLLAVVAVPVIGKAAKRDRKIEDLAIKFNARVSDFELDMERGLGSVTLSDISDRKFQVEEIAKVFKVPERYL